MIISKIWGEKILDSRGEPSILVTVETPKGRSRSSSPSGKSRGKFEAAPFSKRGLDFSISFINVIGKMLINNKVSLKEFSDLEKVEKIVKEYDKTSNWEIIGGNALFALESALLKAMALDQKKELWNFLNPKAKLIPMPLGNCIGGGAHSTKEVHPDVQEFLIAPQARHFYDAYFANLQAYKLAKHAVMQKDKTWNGEITDEKAICPSLLTEEILDLLEEVNKKIHLKYKVPLRIGMDVAASTLWKDGKYHYKHTETALDSEKQIAYFKELIEKYSLFYVEDPLHEEDFQSFSELLRQTKGKTLICGDDLTATHSERLEKAIKEKSVNAVIVKPNQNGSLLETKKFLDLAKKNKITPIISHRSGETADTTISDLAVAWEIPFIKAGILGRERLAKLHRLLKIERELPHS